MVESSIIEISGVGQVLFERSKRAKHLNIAIKPFTGVRVAVPHGLSFKKAEKIVHEKVSWIQKNLEKMKQVELEHKSILENSVEINRTEAKLKLANRLNEFADKYNLTYNRVTFRSQKTRWGSCSQNNNISLNVKLIRLPDELIDYVILHELVHTRIKNHSKKFWDELNLYIGDAKKMDKRLKEYGVGLL